MNKITVIGRVSQDVTTKDFNGRNVANFNVAAQNKNKVKGPDGKDTYGTNFYRVSAWGQSADVAARYLKKGHRVGITGDLIIRPYTGNDNVKYTAVEINNAEIELIETRAESEAKLQAAAGVTSVNTAAPVQNAGFTPVEVDQLPF